MRTHKVLICLVLSPLSMSNCAAMTPYRMTRRTLREAWREPRKEVRISLAMLICLQSNQCDGGRLIGIP